MQKVRPWAVDVSSGIEMQKAIKDPEKIRAFMSAVQRADAQVTQATQAT